ncbi:hypothetical protein AC579_3243 [Pseudocercospora musae]|uniref:Uncharacterized protein n=1 Tax=Pseudocercospora musae TaxID=113226 RepID=A0A139GT61_9PEZI|nr:hypothetical protein AC579_3243 [Pseudocercospora musae]
MVSMFLRPHLALQLIRAEFFFFLASVLIVGFIIIFLQRIIDDLALLALGLARDWLEHRTPRAIGWALIRTSRSIANHVLGGLQIVLAMGQEDGLTNTSVFANVRRKLETLAPAWKFGVIVFRVFLVFLVFLFFLITNALLVAWLRTVDVDLRALRDL